MCKGILTLIVFVGLIYDVNAQIGIGTTSPESSSVLDISATDKGVLIPRVSLTSTNIDLPINNPVNGLIVYNSNVVNDVVVGFYYWEDTEWLRLQNNNDITTVNTTDYSGITNGDTAPVPPEGEGVIVFSDPNFFGWNGTSWVQLD